MKESDLTLEIEYYILRFGLRMKEIRTEKGWTQSEMAKNLRMTRQRISKIEQGKYSFRIETLVRIARLLDLEITELMPTFKD